MDSRRNTCLDEEIKMKRLSREDWDALDDLLGKHGYGGYYDFLECLKIIGRNISAGFLRKNGDLQMIDTDEVKSIPEMMAILDSWSDQIALWRGKHPNWEEEVVDS